MNKADENLHRNNLAEWVMVAVLYPVRLVVRLVAFVSSRAGGPRHG
jgi:hypothetical protein